MVKLSTEETMAVLSMLGKMPTEQVFDLYAFFKVKLEKAKEEEAIIQSMDREAKTPTLEAVK